MGILDSLFANPVKEAANFQAANPDFVGPPAALAKSPGALTGFDNVLGTIADASMANDPIRSGLMKDLPGILKFLGSSSMAYSGPGGSGYIGGNMSRNSGGMTPEMQKIIQRLINGATQGGMNAGGGMIAETPMNEMTVRKADFQLQDANLIPGLMATRGGGFVPRSM